MAMNMGWKDQSQPLPVISPVATATAGVRVEGQPAAHLCLSLPTLGSKHVQMWFVVCTQLLQWDHTLKAWLTAVSQNIQKRWKLSSLFLAFLKSLFGRIHRSEVIQLNHLYFCLCLCYNAACLLQNECFIGNSDGLIFCIKILNLCYFELS